ncbi:hypothetical protein [Hypericibacter sp.]|uniref:hypothetical protein n=1 Tax=Hypericibacter sp. TaxID=2705401 RepID=UPI003D6D287A
MPRTRSVIVGLLGFALYLVLNFDLIQRQLVDFDNAWLCGLGLTLILSAWALEGQGPIVRLIWILVAPVFGSIVGFGLPILGDYLSSGYHRSLSLSQWTKLAVLDPYLPARLWMLSALLLVLSVINHQLLNLRNQTAAKGRS